MDDPVVAALDQDVGHFFAQLQTLCDREEMVLALGRSVFNEIVVGQPLRMNEHGLGHFNCIVECKRADENGRSILHFRQPMCELRTRLDLDIGGKPAQHIVEQRNLLMGIAA